MESTNLGTVKFFSETKNFGFITDNASKEDVFFHASNTLDRVVTGDEVSYNIEKGKRGPKAVEVRRIKK